MALALARLALGIAVAIHAPPRAGTLMIMIRGARWRPLVPALGLLLLVLPAAAGTAKSNTARAAAAHPGKLSARAKQLANAKGATFVDVIVRFRQVPGVVERSVLKSLGAQTRRQIRSSRWLAVRLPAKLAATLAAHNAVDFVATDAPLAAGMDIAREASGE